MGTMGKDINPINRGFLRTTENKEYLGILEQMKPVPPSWGDDISQSPYAVNRCSGCPFYGKGKEEWQEVGHGE